MQLPHSDIRLTMDLYGEFGEDDLFRDQTKLPVQKMFRVVGGWLCADQCAKPSRDGCGYY